MKKVFFVAIVVFLLAGVYLYGRFGGTKEAFKVAKEKVVEVNIGTEMTMLKAAASYVYAMESGGYSNVSCNNEQLKPVCDRIKDKIGSIPVIHSSQFSFCAYVPKNSEEYYCTGGKFSSVISKTDPGQFGYCDGKTFNCPEK